jgi:hypothetical protein
MGVVSEIKKRPMMDKYIIWLVLCIAVAYPILRPIGLPLPIDPMTQEFYDIIDELPPGSKVWMGNAVGSGIIAEQLPGITACMSQLFERGDLKIVIINVIDREAEVIFSEYVLPELERRGLPTEYGKDWAWLPYVPGVEVALAAMAADIRATVSVDRYGTPLDELEVMEGLNSVTDFDLVVLFGHTTPFFSYIRQVVPTGVPFITQGLTMDIPLMMPYYPTQALAMMRGLGGAAEYETLVGYPWRGLSATEALSTTHSWVFIAVIAGNIYYVYTTFVRRKE